MLFFFLSDSFHSIFKICRHLVKGINCSFIAQQCSVVWMYQDSRIRSPFVRERGCPFGDVTHGGRVSIREGEFLSRCANTSERRGQRIDTAGGSAYFLRKYQMVFQSACTISRSHWRCGRGSCFVALGVISLERFPHWSMYAVVFCGGFNFSVYSDYIQVLICHL